MSLISPLAIAPMIDWTYTHFRVFMRLLAPQALLYTEMQTPGAIVHQPHKALAYHAMEHPLALQLGGADLAALVECAQIAEAHGFAEVNLNLGCPSDRVQAGRFGACLMNEPEHVAHCIAAMKKKVKIPITAKTRIGIDHQDSYAFFANFTQRLVDAGCDKLIIHARKAWLKGLSPKQNRTVPPINYEFVYRFKEGNPHIPVVINGNIATLTEVEEHLTMVDGVMLGRLACQNPYAIAEIHQALFKNDLIPSRAEVLRAYVAYLQEIYTPKLSLSLILKPVFNLMHGLPGARGWKEHVLDIQQARDFMRLNELVLYPKSNLG